MMQDTNYSSSPGRSIIYLLSLTFICSLGVQILVVLISYLLSGDINNSLLQGEQTIAGMQGPFYMLFILMTSSIATFLLPVLLLKKLSPTSILPIDKSTTSKIVYVLSILFLVALSPLIHMIGEWNNNLVLPDFLKSIEEWMRFKEDEMSVLTERIVMTDKIPLLLINIIVMAVVPAIVEEYYFRGALIPIIIQWCQNKHIAVWLVALIFSAIHLQFFGFFPRMLLGVVFGYMYLWTGNIGVPIVAHFINNATVAVIAYSYTTQGKSYADMQTYGNYSIFAYLGSLIVATLIGYVLYRVTNIQVHGKRLD